MIFNFKTVKTKLLMILFSSMLMLGAVAIVSSSLLNEQIDHYDALLHTDSAIAVATSNINNDFKTQVQEWKNVLLRGHDTKDREKYWGKFLSIQANIQAQATTLLNADFNANAKATLAEFAKEHKSILSQYKDGYQIYLNNNYDHKLADTSVRGIDRKPSKLLSQTVELTQQFIENKSNDLQTESDFYQVAAYTAVLLTLLISIVLSGKIISRRITTPLSRLIGQLALVSKGDCKQSITLEGNDEISNMAKAIEKVRLKMSGLAQQLQQNQSELNKVSASISASATALTDKATDQYQQALEIDDATTQMSNAAKQMTIDVEEGTNIAKEAAGSAQKSRDVMQSTLNSITLSSQQIQRTSDVILQLDEDTKTVGSVVEVINGIAEQTNLLALNAAIEAARAGEQGRGFAVVADEVRTLASRTQQSTEEIKSIIAKLQARAMGAVSAIEEGRQTVNDSETSVNKASEVLNKVDKAVAGITLRNQQISASLDEQSSLNSIISNRVVALRITAEQNKAQAAQLVLQNDNLETVRAALAHEAAELTR